MSATGINSWTNLIQYFFNDIFLILGQDLYTITATGKTIDDLETKSESVIEWMDNNNMIANPGKFKAIVLSKNNIDTVGTKFQI